MGTVSSAVLHICTIPKDYLHYFAPKFSSTEKDKQAGHEAVARGRCFRIDVPIATGGFQIANKAVAPPLPSVPPPLEARLASLHLPLSTVVVRWFNELKIRRSTSSLVRFPPNPPSLPVSIVSKQHVWHGRRRAAAAGLLPHVLVHRACRYWRHGCEQCERSQ